MKIIYIIILSFFFLAQKVLAATPEVKIEELKLELQELQIKEDKKKQGILEFKSFDTTIILGGRLQVNAEYTTPSGSFFAGKIPLANANNEDDFTLHAKDSRLWVKTRTPEKYGPILTLIEVDFRGENEYELRLRHAYIEYAGFGFGKTNSAFNSIVALDTITYAIDDTFVRQVVARYTYNVENTFYDISFEEPDTTLFVSESSKSATSIDGNLAPDLVLRVRYYSDSAEVGLAYLSRLIKKEADSSSKDAQYAWGINLSGGVDTFGLDDIRFNAHYGVGSGRYIGYNAFGAGVINQTTNEIDLTTVYGGHLGYRHWWNNSFRSTLGVSYLASNTKQEDKDDFGFLTEVSQGFVVNLFWTPRKNISIGVEFARAKREVYNSQNGMMSDSNLMFRYDF